MDRIKKAISSTAKKVTSAVRSLGSSSLTASAVKATPTSSSALSNLIQKARPASKTTPAPTTTAPTTTAPMTMAPMTPSQAGIRQTLVPTMSTALGPAAVTDTGQTVIYGRGGPVVFEAGNVPTTGLGISGAPTTIQRQGANAPATRTSNITTPLLTNEPLARSVNVTSETLSAPATSSVVMPTSAGMQNVGTVTNAGLVNMMADSGFDYVPETNQFVARPMEGVNKEQQIQSLTGQISDLVTRALPKRERVLEDSLVQAQQEEVRKARQELANYAGQLNEITAKQQADLLNLRGIGSREGVTETVYGGQAAAINREAAIRALPIQAQIATAQGNVELAQDYLKQIIDIKNEEIDNNYEYNKAVYNTLKDYADTNQKRILDRINKEEDRAFELQKSNLNALARAYENVAGDANAIGRLRNINTASPNASLEIANIVGQTKSQTGQTEGASVIAQTYANLLKEGKITLSNVPANIRNQVVAVSGGEINRPLSDTAIKEITQSQSAISNLQALRGVVQSNLEFVGPISGLQRFNPYSDARKAQADIDRVRQVVGKSLEGGVLRKEDEEKYKKILATLSDTPETALYKIDALIGQIQRDINNYQSNQATSGRFVPSQELPTADLLREKYNY